MLNIKKIHIVGICGTLMGNAAVYLKEQGYEVRGSDSGFYPPISDLLQENEMQTYNGFDKKNLEWQPDLVVIGNAISRGNPEAEFVLNNKLNYMSLPELLKYVFIDKKDSIVVTGTHGKTSTTTILANVFTKAGKDPSYMIGGIPVGFASGFNAGGGEEVVLEGDEYDTAFFDKRSKFLHYKPRIVILNNIEFDHGDIFNSIDDIKLSFRRLVNIVPSAGHLVANFDDQNVIDVTENSLSHIESYGKSTHCKWQIVDIDYKSDRASFSLKVKDGNYYQFDVPACGEYQIYNYTASIIVALLCGIKEQSIQDTLHDIEGVKRRLEYRGQVNGCDVIEDFAHHPTAINGVLSEMKRRFEGKKILAVFEPRSNTTRRNIFQEELADAFSFADKIIIGKINREHLLTTEEKLDIDLLGKTLVGKGCDFLHYNEVDMIVKEIKGTINEDWACIIMSNGSFDGIFEKLPFEKLK